MVINNKTGLLVECGDYAGLAAAAIRLLENDELAQHLIAMAREECRKYSWEAVREGWLKVYRDLEIGQKSGHRSGTKNQRVPAEQKIAERPGIEIVDRHDVRHVE